MSIIYLTFSGYGFYKFTQMMSTNNKIELW